MASGVKMGRTSVGTGENEGSAVGVAVGVNVGVWVGIAVWVRATPVCTMAMAVLCMSVVGGVGTQAAKIPIMHKMSRAFLISCSFCFMAF